MMDIDEIIETFELLEDWEERYRLIIDLGRGLPDMAEPLKVAENKVEGCVSQVWLVLCTDARDAERLHILADSDAHIVRGLIAVLIAAYDGKTAGEIRNLDAMALMRTLGLDEHLSPNRRNGLVAMVARINQQAARIAGAAIRSDA